MGIVLGSVDNGGMFGENTLQTTSTSFSSTKQIGNLVMYKLVRVAGDGRLVPATDEEIMEVEDLVENDTNDKHIVTHPGQTIGHISDGCLTSGLPHSEGSKGMTQVLSESDNAEASSDKLVSHVECTVDMLQMVKGEGRLCVTLGTQKLPACLDSNVSCSTENKLSGSKDEIRSTNDCNRHYKDQQMKAEPCLNDVGGSAQDTDISIASQKPDFSTVRGEICLDNLSIKALQETFRATFGRVTTVKDKLWLKKRIAMGLLNSCCVSTTCFTIKDNRLVGGQFGNFNIVNDGFNKDMAPTSPSNQADQKCGGEDFASELRAAKRQRKRTRRYIEELSETDERQESGKSMNPSKERTPKSLVRSIGAASSGGRLVVTRMVSIAGSRMQVPFVFQVRRSRPRENVKALVFASGSLNNNEQSECSPSVMDQDMEEEEEEEEAGNSLDENQDDTPTLSSSAFRRKHHRAWTLSEVVKLVEGVAKHGAGKWSEIKRLSFASHSYRTSVDLKDKWRNLLKASFAQMPSMKAGTLRKHGSMPIPTPILVRVRELAEKQSQLPPPVNKAAGDN